MAAPSGSPTPLARQRRITCLDPCVPFGEPHLLGHPQHRRISRSTQSGPAEQEVEISILIRPFLSCWAKDAEVGSAPLAGPGEGGWPGLAQEGSCRSCACHGVDTHTHTMAMCWFWGGVPWFGSEHGVVDLRISQTDILHYNSVWVLSKLLKLGCIREAPSPFF